MRGEGTIRPEQVIMVLDELVKDRDTILTTDVGSTKCGQVHAFHTTRPRTFVSSGGAGTMDLGFRRQWALSSACPIAASSASRAMAPSR